MKQYTRIFHTIANSLQTSNNVHLMHLKVQNIGVFPITNAQTIFRWNIIFKMVKLTQVRQLCFFVTVKNVLRLSHRMFHINKSVVGQFFLFISGGIYKQNWQQIN